MNEPTWDELRLMPIRERVIRGCGQMHTGVCAAEREARWSKPGAWIPPEYRGEVAR